MNDLDHTVLAVGYRTYTLGHETGKYTIIRNSWSTHWGDNGYMYMSQRDNICGAATAPTYVTL